MGRVLLTLLLLAIVPLSVGASEVCPVYGNSGWMTGGTRAVFSLTVPEGATGIDSWMFGAAVPDNALEQPRVAVRLNVRGKMVSHWVTRHSDQSELRRPGAKIRLEPGDEVTFEVRVAGDGGARAKGNVWVYFLMPSGY